MGECIIYGYNDKTVCKKYWGHWDNVSKKFHRGAKIFHIKNVSYLQVYASYAHWVDKSLTFFCISERYLATVDELEVIVLRLLDNIIKKVFNITTAAL